ncbi:hypothetical protein DL96DRAFT_1439229, partial [Flagelloscypha sp. PMI_526]
PHPNQVQDVRTALAELLPPELTEYILDLAEYWPQLRFKVTKPFSGYPNSDSQIDWCYLATPPLVLGEEGVLTNVEFRIISHDQGWTSDLAFQGTYNGSYSWFDASIYRPCKANEGATWLDDVMINGPVDMLGDILPSDGLNVPYMPLTKDRWLLQRNVCADHQDKTHVILWSRGRDDVPSPPGEMDLDNGCGDGLGFAGSLKDGDRIAVFSRAMFLGWRNYVNSITVTLTY